MRWHSRSLHSFAHQQTTRHPTPQSPNSRRRPRRWLFESAAVYEEYLWRECRKSGAFAPFPELSYYAEICKRRRSRTGLHREFSHALLRQSTLWWTCFAQQNVWNILFDLKLSRWTSRWAWCRESEMLFYQIWRPVDDQEWLRDVICVLCFATLVIKCDFLFFLLFCAMWAAFLWSPGRGIRSASFDATLLFHILCNIVDSSLK